MTDADAAVLRRLSERMRGYGLDFYEDGGATERLFASSTVAEILARFADELDTALAELQYPTVEEIKSDD